MSSLTFRLSGLKEGVETLNFFIPPLLSSEPEGTNTGISATLGESVANLLDKLETLAAFDVEGWKDGVLKLYFRLDSVLPPTTIVDDKRTAGDEGEAGAEFSLNVAADAEVVPVVAVAVAVADDGAVEPEVDVVLELGPFVGCPL